MEQTPIVEPPAAPVAAEPPPAAAIVLSGTVTERETNLQAELAAERQTSATSARELKARETRIAELEDQINTLRGARPSPARKSIMEAFLAGEEID